MSDPVTIYRPAKSWGRLWLGLLALVVIGLGVFSAWALVAAGLAGLAIVLAPTDVAISLVFLLPFFWYGGLRYELGDDRLVLRCGWAAYTIHLADITGIQSRDLAFSWQSSMRLPGFALGEVIYGGGTGSVTMCATRVLKGILVIEAGRKRYGLTPADEAAFVADLERRAGRPLRAVGSGLGV